MNRCNFKSVTVLVLAIGGILGTGTSQAVTKVRSFSATATSDCQSSLPVFDVQIRKRPLAVQNEGDANAYVTCSFTRQWDLAGPISIEMNVINLGAAARSVTCTLVVGSAISGSPAIYFPKEKVVNAGNSQQLLWSGADFANGFPNNQVSMLCNLQPWVGLAESYLVFSEDVGQ